MAKLWTLRIAASLGCAALFGCSFAAAMLVLPRSWHDLDDANVRMQIFRFHIFDPDFIWAAVAFGANIAVVAAMFACSLWMLWLLVSRWDAMGRSKSN